MYENNIYSGDDAGSNTTGYSTSYTGNFGAAQPDRAEKKTSQRGFFRKALLSISLGLFFGLFAGIGFYAVKQTSELMNGSSGNETVISQNVEENSSMGQAESQSGIKLTDTGSIRVVSSDVTEVVDEVMPAMVAIINNYRETGMTFFGQGYERENAASGSGIIVAENETELLIATNNHVVADATRLEVAFIDGTTAEAQVKGKDSEMDLALISIPLSALSEETKNAISIAAMGDSDELKLGEPVIAIGNALGYGQSVTNGIVSALDRQITMDDGTVGTFIQTNAAINPGNSGGALLNVNGEVIGINSVKIGSSVVEGMGYAIPISSAKPIISELMLKETRTRVADGNVGYMGINPQTITDQVAAWYNLPQGVYVTGVEENGPAKEAGMLPGDILVKFEGEKLTSYEDLQEVLQYYGPGTTVTVTVKRPVNGEYQSIELTMTLAKRPDR